ncbi:MAG: hypothetical protein K6G81_05260 [Lachnospiraceae bacterium]|nr:hypothetical protein [Lachnospiraceae bacterium]
MGLFSNRKKKQNTNDQENIYQWMTVEEALEYNNAASATSEESVKKLADEMADQMQFLKVRQDQTKYEYDEVCSYLDDIKILENLGEETRGAVTDAARMIIGLDEEKTRYQTGERKILGETLKTLKLYEKDIPRKIRELENQEDYLALVRDDMRNLEGEKGSITYNRDQANDKKKFLISLTYAVTGLILVIFIVLIVLMDRTGKDFTIPFFLTGLAGAAYGAYFIYEFGRCRTLARQSEYMLNRANVLLNKIKIKYVNTTNALEYSYEKYGVNSAKELKHKWSGFVHDREEEQRYRKNSQLLVGYEDNLERLLKGLGLKKADSWVNQPSVLVSRRELSEFKDGVTNRKNKLRAQLDFNLRQQDSTMNDIEGLKRKYSDFGKTIDAIIKKNDID